MLRLKLIPPFLLVVLLLAALNSQACDCKTVSFRDESNRSDLIFRGRVLSKSDSVLQNATYYTFNVLQKWKGDSIKTITVKTNSSPIFCGAIFTLGEEYIVYAANGLTSYCSRNELFRIGSDLPQLNYKYIQNEDAKFGVDKTLSLNEFESVYFTSIFNNTFYQTNKPRKQFDFKNKQVAFFYNGGFISKTEFFEINKSNEPIFGLIMLNEKEIRKANGYSGIIYIDGMPKLSKREAKKITKQLI